MTCMGRNYSTSFLPHPATVIRAMLGRNSCELGLVSMRNSCIVVVMTCSSK